MREQLCQIDNPDPVTRMRPQRSLVSVFSHESSAWRSAFHFFQVLADALRVNTTITEFYLYDNDNPIGDEGVKASWPQRGGGLEDHREHRDPRATICSRDGFGTLSRYLKVGFMPGLQQPKFWLIAWGYPSACVGFSGSSLQHWQALAAALEANKTIKDVGLSDDQLTDEGMQASLLGMKGGELPLGGPCWCPVH